VQNAFDVREQGEIVGLLVAVSAPERWNAHHLNAGYTPDPSELHGSRRSDQVLHTLVALTGRVDEEAYRGVIEHCCFPFWNTTKNRSFTAIVAIFYGPGKPPFPNKRRCHLSTEKKKGPVDTLIAFQA